MFIYYLFFEKITLNQIMEKFILSLGDYINEFETCTHTPKYIMTSFVLYC